MNEDANKQGCNFCCCYYSCVCEPDMFLFSCSLPAEAMQQALADLTSIQTKYFAVSEKLSQHTHSRLSNPGLLTSPPFTAKLDFSRSPGSLDSRRTSLSRGAASGSQHRNRDRKNINWWSTPPVAEVTRSKTASGRNDLQDNGKRRSAATNFSGEHTSSLFTTPADRAGEQIKIIYRHAF